MELELHIGSTPVAKTLRQYAERRFQFALRRLAHRVRRLRIQLMDLNGPRGGVDKRCKILADIAPSGTVVVEETDVHVYEAVDRAADRLRRSIRRDVKRRQAHRLGKGRSRSIRYPETVNFVEVEAFVPPMGP